MHLITTVLASFAALLQLAAADFDIYAVAAGKPNSTECNFQGWSVFPDTPSCDEAWNAPALVMMPDLTGDIAGIRCQGGIFGYYIGYQGAITELEMTLIENKNSPSRRFSEPPIPASKLGKHWADLASHLHSHQGRRHVENEGHRWFSVWQLVRPILVNGDNQNEQAS
jgi:hypothetical protein